ncbi:MAG: HAMP domain-containing histidine kinase [Clostridiales bacterium]|nr:HAMP domain-containing histidine kinase [Clostridiales bacterium]
MDKIKHIWRDLSLRKSIILYISAFVILAIALSAVTSFLCNNAIETIGNSYPPTGEKYYLTNEAGEKLGGGSYIGTEPSPLSEKDKTLKSLYGLIPIIATPLYSALCIITAALLFYRNKLKRPLAELKTASERISDNDLDFSIDYECNDELGRLCTSFEIMRSTLASNFSEMWRQVEERKQLNAAFAHDLRTPLTVLKGYDEMLQTSKDNKTKETAITMGRHILRLEHYIDSMSSLQRLEDAQPEYTETPLQEFLSSLMEGAEMLCSQNGKKLNPQNRTVSNLLNIDKSFVSQVCNNLISNALRYAISTITLTFEEKDKGLLLSVSDDGKGFSKKVLSKATNPYFTEEENHSEHFGLGLYICKVLCEHHGGYIKTENIDIGAKVSAFFKPLSL